MIKYVILLHFYVSFLQKHKNNKNTRSNEIKKNPVEVMNTCIMRFQTTSKQRKFWPNHRWIKCQIFKSQEDNLNFDQITGGYVVICSII